VYPRYETLYDGKVVNHSLAEPELAVYQGLLGHYHVTANKSDPGPAFDWPRARRLIAAATSAYGKPLRR